MAHLHQADDITLIPFKKDFEKYSWNSLSQDMMAGLSVAMLSLPQAMAYALVAGLPISCGLWAVIFSAIVVAIFGSSRHLIVGPSNAISILIHAGISGILFTYFRDVTGPEKETLVLQIFTQLLLLVALIQISAAFLKLGRLTHFVSHSVVVAYLSGVALALIINQLFPLLGMVVPTNAASLYERGIYIFSHLKLIHWPTAAIGLSCFGLLVLLRRIDRKIPAGAIMLAAMALIAYGVDHGLSYLANQESFSLFDVSLISETVQQVAIVGETRGDGLIPTFDWPYFNTGIMNQLIPVAFAIALLSVMETVSTVKALAANSGQHLSINQEILGLGIGNVFSSLIGAMPLSGSPSRSAISYENGAKTRLAAIFNSISIALILLAFSFLVRRIPIAAFAALLIVTSASVVNFKQVFLCLKATRSDALVFTLTLLACIFFSLDMAFYIGVTLSITLYLKKAAVPQLIEFSVDQGGNLHSIEHAQLHEPRKVRFIKVEGELFFGAADLFQTALKAIAEDDTTTRVIILQLKNARDIDATACLALQQLYHYLRSSGRHLIACGLPHQIWDVLSDSGMIDLIGKENLFIFDERHPYLSVQRAFARAHHLLQEDTAPLPAEQVSEAPMRGTEEAIPATN
jgi:SulP family sulfate permease